MKTRLVGRSIAENNSIVPDEKGEESNSIQEETTFA